MSNFLNGMDGITNRNQDKMNSALIVICQFVEIVKTKPKVLDSILAEMDLNDDAFDEEFAILKGACNYD